MFCQNCGKEVGENDRFCKNCGVVTGYTRQEEEPAVQPGTGDEPYTYQQPPEPQDFVSFQNEPEQKADSSGKMTTWIMVGAVAAFGLVVLIILAVLVGASRRGAKERLEQWEDQQERSYEYSSPFDDLFDTDEDDYDYDDFDGDGFDEDDSVFGGPSGTGEENRF